MGATCGTDKCCGDSSQISAEIGSRDSMKQGDALDRFKPMDNMSDSARQSLLLMGSTHPSFLKTIVRIQAHFRGWRDRKRLEEIKEQIQNGTENGEFDNTINENELLSNERVKEVFDNNGRFNIPDLKGTAGQDLVNKGPYRLTSGAIYIGSWQSDLSKRAGKGRQVWLDGSLYEG